MVLLSATSTIAREMVGLRHSERSSTLMVNAACMSEDNLTLSKEPIVVYI
jgi:RNA:NAD 2'-phosphotransferase (TPT1/KptA family)